jgi:adenylate cyclase
MPFPSRPARVLPVLREAALPLLAALLFAGVAAIVARPVEFLARDLLVSAFSPFTRASDDIVLVKITEDTLKAFPYRSPIDRAYLADLIDRVAAAKPKAIGLDILFDQASEPDKDARLETALAAAPVAIAAATAEDGLTPAQIAFQLVYAPATTRGLATLWRDADGTVREAFAGENGIAGLAAATARIGGAAGNLPEGPLVYYRKAEGGPYRFKAYPAHAVRLAPPAWFRDKFVLIGVDLPNEDRHASPFAALEGVEGGALPGLEIHGHALAQLLSGDRILRPPLALSALATALICAAAAWLGLRPGSVLAKPALAALALMALWAAAALAFRHWAVAAPLALPSMLAAGAFAGGSVQAWRREAEERRFIRQAFQKYVSPSVVDGIVADPERLHLGGERREITLVFTDIEGYTALTETLPPETTATVLNEYLNRMLDLFVAHGATIDKLIGDAVVGFFGAPGEEPDQANRAVGLALAIDALSESFRAEMRQRGLALGATRVGVHKGMAIVGNFGGERFFDYTAIGDTVNTASRLEGANKFVATRLCVSGEVARAVTAHTLRPSAILYLKGKRQGVETFEPLHPGSTAHTSLDEYREAFQLMQAGDRRAAAQFRRLARLYPQDSLVALHAQRLEAGKKGAEIRLSEK